MLSTSDEGGSKRDSDQTYSAVLPLRSWVQLTPSRLSPSRRWRGITVTISISQRKAISGGVKPEGNVEAMSQAGCYL